MEGKTGQPLDAGNGTNEAGVYVVRSVQGLYLRAEGGASPFTHLPGEAATFPDPGSAESYLEGRVSPGRRLDYAVYERGAGGEEVLVR